MFLSIIIPAYNEAKRLPKTLINIDQYLRKRDFKAEILVVDDGSTDQTVKIVKDMEESIEGLKVIDNQKNHGKGWVVRQGLLMAKGKIRLFMDADGSTSIDHFDKMIPYFKQGYDIVIGSRDDKDISGAEQAVKQSWLKRFLGNIGNMLIQILAVPGIWDTQCGFKAFTTEVVENIFPKMRIDRWGFDIEALALARKMKMKIAIIPVYWINDPHSKVKLKEYLRTFSDLIKIWFWLKTGKYKV